MFAKIFIIVATMAYSYSFASEQAWTNRAVVMEKYTSTSSYNGTFKPGRTVTIEKENDGNVFVVEGVWIPKALLATKDMFKRLDKWEGKKSIDVESVDLDVKYTIDSLARVKFVIYDTSGSATFTGQLYRYKNVLWVKSPIDDEILDQNIFWILPNGNLCSPDPDAGNCPAPKP